MSDRAGTEPLSAHAPDPVVIVVTADDDRYAAAREAAMQIATRESARLLLYDWDSATVLGDPLPSWWSGDGSAEDVPSELDEAALHAAGRSAIADQVAAARSKGIDAAAWLPSKPGAEALADYARHHGATTIVVAEDLHATGGLERLTEGPSNPDDAIEGASAAQIVIIPRTAG